MAEGQVTQRDEQQIEELHKQLTARALPKGVNICEVWAQIKSYWPIIVRLAKLIPKVGTKISEILEKLGQALDMFCPAEGHRAS